jgi:hypothetical protein
MKSDRTERRKFGIREPASLERQKYSHGADTHTNWSAQVRQ